jgi:hypothetical protein
VDDERTKSSTTVLSAVMRVIPDIDQPSVAQILQL